MKLALLSIGRILALSATSFVMTTASMPATLGQQPPFSHQDWNEVLEEFVDERGLVEYQRLSGHRQALDRYLRTIESISPESSPDLFPTSNHALAYYLNAYNAQVFKGVLSRGPEKKSVWRGLISGYNFFVRMSIQIGGREMNLKSLEDDVIREDFKDPRVHAALNCASLGCPRLPREAFYSDKLDQQLTAAMTEFVSEERNVEVDHSRHRVTISKIFDWFEEDFLEYERRQGGRSPKILDYINRYRESGATIPRGYSVKYSSYDKRINSQ